GCIHQCSLGARQCSANGFVVCEMQSSGCTDWGEETPCPEGQICSAGQCIGGGCVNQCSLGARQCSVNGFVVCEMQSSGCTGWGEETPCPGGQICSAGQCIGGGCVNQCSLGARQCAPNGGYLECALQTSGCTDWGTATACPAGQVCFGGECVTDCVNRCSLGARQCAPNGGFLTCEMTAAGCTDWGAETACAEGEVCSGGRCVLNCADQCSVGARQCSAGGYRTCAQASTGCTEWGEEIACPDGEICSGGQCVRNCVDQCSEGARQCSGFGVQTCERMASGCTEWGDAVPCASGQVCSGGICTGNCTNQCTAGATRCAGTNHQTCREMSSGCTDWDTPQPCAEGACFNGACNAGVCVAGELRCNGTNVEECDAGGYWVVRQVCPQSCELGQCTLTATCTAGERRCNNSVVEECNASETAWLFVRACPNGCENGLCTGGCTPGEKRCNGDVVEVCPPDGSDFAGSQTCSTFCTGGRCAEANLLLDNTTVTLDGEHVYAGDVWLRNNSRIQVGPLGWLRIRAANITVDSTSSIEAPAVGDDPSGRGQDGGSRSCQNPSCTYSTSGTVSGAGGGYGTSGSGDSQSLYNCYSSYYGSLYCSISSQGGSANGAYVADLHVGSRGGSCSQPNGGGMIDLIASDAIAIAGNVLANGGSGSDGGGGSCAGGSGGGIRLVADDLTVTGLLSANGGSPRGGQGRIKLLYGARQNVAATMNGVVETSRIPPLDLRSSTHPDQARVYNDGFDTFNVAWTRPFDDVAAYYYDLTSALPSSQSQVPDAQSSYEQGETVSFTKSQIPTGTTYFNVISVGPMASFGTLESAFRVRVNATPPTISSSSHPSSSQWYAQPTAIFSWTDPIAADNFRGYYYRFDRYADTIPTKSDSFLPVTTKQLMQASLPPGSIWFLHLVSEDTAGYLTRTAQHFKIQVGPEPGMGGISGNIREQGSTPPKMLDGVEVTLNRGLQSTTSATGGQYFFSNTVYAGSYELRATKSGYEPFVTQVSVTAGQNTSLNIEMVKSQ
ncbi:MAG: carboxypeptidase regulatory-like domain-containing protein, partial [Myxococcales bacterium]